MVWLEIEREMSNTAPEADRRTAPEGLRLPCPERAKVPDLIDVSPVCRTIPDNSSNPSPFFIMEPGPEIAPSTLNLFSNPFIVKDRFDFSSSSTLLVISLYILFFTKPLDIICVSLDDPESRIIFPFIKK
jgi:hypothetical protein